MTSADTVATPVVRWNIPSPGIAVLELDRGPANALGTPIIEGLNTALDELDALGSIRVLVISSAVAGFFAAGADIKLMSTVDLAGFEAYGDSLRATVDRIDAHDRIVIAAIEGLALGGGLELALACTMRIAGRDAKFGLPEVKLGLIPGAGGTQRLPRLIGTSRALDLMLTARQAGAEEAYAFGIVDRLVDAGSALAVALEAAEQIVSASRAAQNALLTAVDAANTLSVDEGFATERAEIGTLFESGEGPEGIAAFVERRTPNFG